MVIRHLLITILFCLVFIPLGANAQPNYTIEFDVQPRSGSLEDSYTLSVTISGGSSVQKPKVKSNQDFKIVGNATKALTSLGIAQMTTKEIYEFNLIPKHPGILHTPPIEIIVDGKVKRLGTLKVKVTKSSVLPDEAKRDVILRQLTEPKKVYVGQQVVNTLELLTRIHLLDPEFETANFDGFWAQKLGKDQTGTLVVRGKRYDAYRIRHALFPLREGQLELSERTVNVKMRESRSPSRVDPFGMRLPGILDPGPLRRVTLRSNPSVIEVEALPPAPADFKNWGLTFPIVGATKLTVDYSNRSIAPGESKTVKVTLVSSGNISPIKDVQLNTPPNMRVYSEIPEQMLYEDAGTLLLKRVFTLTIVPLASGQVEIPPIELGFFDPRYGAYLTTQTRPISFLVTGNVSPPPSAEPSLSESPKADADEAPVSEPRLTYQSPGRLEYLLSRVSLSLLIMAIVGLTVVAVFGSILWRLRLELAPLWRAKASISNAATHADLSAAFDHYLSLKLPNLPNLSSPDHVKAVLEKHISNRELRFAVQLLVDELAKLKTADREEGTSSLADLKRKIERVVRDW